MRYSELVGLVRPYIHQTRQVEANMSCKGSLRNVLMEVLNFYIQTVASFQNMHYKELPYLEQESISQQAEASMRSGESPIKWDSIQHSAYGCPGIYSEVERLEDTYMAGRSYWKIDRGTAVVWRGTW